MRVRTHMHGITYAYETVCICMKQCAYACTYTYAYETVCICMKQCAYACTYTYAWYIAVCFILRHITCHITSYYMYMINNITLYTVFTLYYTILHYILYVLYIRKQRESLTHGCPELELSVHTYKAYI